MTRPGSHSMKRRYRVYICDRHGHMIFVMDERGKADPQARQLVAAVTIRRVQVPHPGRRIRS